MGFKVSVSEEDGYITGWVNGSLTREVAQQLAAAYEAVRWLTSDIE